MNVRRNATIASRPRIQNVFVHAAALSPKNSTKGNVTILIVKVPAVARRFLKILSTDLSYGFWVISAFKDEYGTFFRMLSTDKEVFTHTEDQTNIYTLVIKFPKQYNKTEYQDIIEAISIEIASRQLIQE